MPESKLVRVSIAARMLGVHYRTALRWVKDGKVSGVEMSGRWYIHRTALHRLIHERASSQ